MTVISVSRAAIATSSFFVRDADAPMLPDRGAAGANLWRSGALGEMEAEDAVATLEVDRLVMLRLMTDR